MHYFSPDGNYGPAGGLEIIDTSDFTDDDWDEIEESFDEDRPETARKIRRDKDKYKEEMGI